VQEIESRGRLRLVETEKGARFELVPDTDDLATFH
jgi:hypothetical protein